MYLSVRIRQIYLFIKIIVLTWSSLVSTMTTFWQTSERMVRADFTAKLEWLSREREGTSLVTDGYL